MKRLVSTVLALALVATAALQSPAPAAAYLDCPYYGGVGFEAWSGNSAGGVWLGQQCAINANQGWDSDFSDSRDGFRGSDNDVLSSFKFKGRYAETWCLTLFKDKNFSGSSLTYRSYNGAGVTVYMMPDGWNDVVSSILFERKSTLSARCP
jgi:hypothetical protein